MGRRYGRIAKIFRKGCILSAWDKIPICLSRIDNNVIREFVAPVFETASSNWALFLEALSGKMASYRTLSMKILVFLLLTGQSTLMMGQDLAMKENDWVDSVYQTMSLRQRIGQLFMIRAHSDKGASHIEMVKNAIREEAVGGLCFFQGTPLAQLRLTNEYQALADIPLLVAQDAEYGLGMRLNNTFHFPFQMTMGAMDDDSLVYEAGREIARQLKRIGVRMNFAPVVDVNNNPDNPIINSRSFGEKPYRVAAFGAAYMKGLQDEKVMAVAKHFPGHGDTDMDSHKTLPLVSFGRNRLDSIELVPFKALIDSGVSAVMIAHLAIPAIEPDVNLPTTLSAKVVADLLTTDLGFEGLKITDALEMKGVSGGFRAGEAALKALKAGNDILLLPADLPKAISAIQKAVKNGEITDSFLEKRVKKQLHFKYQYGLHTTPHLDSLNLMQDLNNDRNFLLSKKIFEKAITLLQNKNEILPLRSLDTLKIAALSIGDAQKNDFQKTLSKYTKIDTYNRFKGFEHQASFLDALAQYDEVVVSFHNTSIFPHRKFGLKERDIAFVDSLSKRTKVIVCLFASPYALNLLPDDNDFQAIVVGYEDTDIAQSTLAQMIMGALPMQGHLPVSTRVFPAMTGIKTTSLGRLKYGKLIEAGLPDKVKIRIDSIVYANIQDRAFPGCQLLIAKDGIVVMDETYGYHTYDKSEEVRKEDLYDIASLTKIFATTASVMRLDQEGILDIDLPLTEYLPYLKHSNKKALISREIMAHQARLKPWIPFYTQFLDVNKQPSKEYFSHEMKLGFTLKVGENLYAKDELSYVIYQKIANSPLRKKRKYKYSDLGFYLLKQAIENVTNMPFENYVQKTFYSPLGMYHTCFNPLRFHSRREIVPTEDDQFFRHQLIHGYVHDPGAALLGGVSGHAGLFSNANDLAIMAQMFLQKGFYGGVQYVDTVQLETFTKAQYPLNENRRGVGFDRPEDKREEGPSCDSTTDDSFGHSGFTGTYFWVDPVYNLVYVFLSNRVNPSADNHKLVKNNVRTNIMQVVYDEVTAVRKMIQ
jgi:beta-glucosidase-like glycosyl hydrolase/CubicO group peptidase (beta-lactamase class C family)